MNEVWFEVPGLPVGKARPRATMTGRMYTPSKTANYESFVAYIYDEKYHNQKFGYGVPIVITITAYYPIPKSTPKKHIQPMLDGAELPTKKPDADNIAKIICDALNRLAYEDDAQITGMVISKRYSEFPRVEVSITEAL